MGRLLLVLWIISAIALLLYSFTQVDLSLTLSQVSIWQGIQKSFQYIGYFNRPLSTYIFITIIGVMFALYGLTLKLVQKNLIERKTLFIIVVFLSVILFFAYNAFSYDLFNYIFDAKILAHYGQNPYEHKALDYSGDPMLSFMHWTHRVYPYGPIWLLITVPIYFIGFGYFLVTFYLFKLLMALSFIGSALLIEKIAKKTGVNPMLAVAAFALNPLVLIESLVSAHNDIVMIVFALLALLMYLEKKYIKSLLFIVISIAIKYATALIIPAILIREKFKKNPDVFYYALILSMGATVVLASSRTNFQPWYLLYMLPFAAFVQNKYFVAIPVFIVSFFALMQYVPYLYLGNWNPPVPQILSYLLYGSLIGSVILVFAWKVLKRN